MQHISVRGICLYMCTTVLNRIGIVLPAKPALQKEAGFFNPGGFIGIRKRLTLTPLFSLIIRRSRANNFPSEQLRYSTVIHEIQLHRLEIARTSNICQK